MAEYSDAGASVCFDVERKRKLRDTLDYVRPKPRYDNNLSELQFMSRFEIPRVSPVIINLDDSDDDDDDDLEKSKFLLIDSPISIETIAKNMVKSSVTKYKPLDKPTDIKIKRLQKNMKFKDEKEITLFQTYNMEKKVKTLKDNTILDICDELQGIMLKSPSIKKNVVHCIKMVK